MCQHVVPIIMTNIFGTEGFRHRLRTESHADGGHAEHGTQPLKSPGSRGLFPYCAVTPASFYASVQLLSRLFFFVKVTGALAQTVPRRNRYNLPSMEATSIAHLLVQVQNGGFAHVYTNK